MVFRIDSQRTIKSTGETSRQTRYYISSLEAQAKQFNTRTRSHWAFENNLHWTLDVVFGEDRSRKRKGYSARNFNAIRKTVMALLVNEQQWKASKKKKKTKGFAEPRIQRNFTQNLNAFALFPEMQGACF